MSRLTRLARRGRAFLLRAIDPFRRRTRDQDLRDELQAHLQLHIDDHLRAGLSPAEARRRALLALGGTEAVSEQYRDRRGLPALDRLLQDVRHAARLIRRSPGFSLVIVLSLALGIGANATMFSLLDALLLRALPVRAPEQLAMFSQRDDSPSDSWSYPVWEQVRQRGSLVAGVCAWSSAGLFALHEGGPAATARGLYVSGEFFDVLGVPAVLGRTLDTGDDRRGGGASGPVAVISYRFWQDHFGGAPTVIGQPLVLNQLTLTIVGVAPADFFGAVVGDTFDVALPFGLEPLLRGRDSLLDDRSSRWLVMMARLRPDQTVAQAAAGWRSVRPQIFAVTVPGDWRAEDQDDYRRTPLALYPAANGASSLRARYQRPLTTLLAIVGLVLLIACANIANLLLARASARRQEFALRLALGASRPRLARQLIVESLVLSAAGAAAGLLIAAWSSRLLVRAISTRTDRIFLDLTLDWRVLAFTAGVATLTTLVFGTTPALMAARSEPQDALNGPRGALGDHRSRVGGLFVIVQVALSLVLVAGAGLFIATLVRLERQPLGFDPEGVLIADVSLHDDAVTSVQRSAVFERLRAAAAAVPGVASATMSVHTPASGRMGTLNLQLPADPAPADGDRTVFVHTIGREFFATYRTPLLAGRDFTDADSAGGRPVVIVNEAFARRYFGGRNPLGQLVQPRGRPGHPQPVREVVGYVGDAVYRNLRQPVPPTIYIPLAQADWPYGQIQISVRAMGGSPGRLIAPLDAALRREGVNLSVSYIPLLEQVANTLIRERLLATVSGVFGGLALLLAGIGLYGVTAYAVARRRTELGIRMALGAAPERVIGLVVRRVAGLVGVGLLGGIAVTLWMSRFVETLLFGLTSRDATTLGGAAAVLALIALVAAWLPARRAARIDPARVLRAD